ncbi:MAG TPA: glutamine-hydrolyzing carbamoyl-phosphate synthase small subunit [Bdellovibrionota bacterium]|nr:glutamine-hydrolyzing carbamoyl-phosphate synthase small subunit [Bdellovibrionota bacterium]
MKPGFLILEDGFELPGRLFGAEVSAGRILEMQQTKGGLVRDRGYGEVVFNTSMTGYQEILTDPSYYGQIVCMTYPHIGNTGVNTEDPESAHPWCAGFIVHETCDEPSNWRSNGGLDAYLKTHGIPGIAEIDTRSLTRHLRTKGVVRGLMLPESERALAKELLAKLPGFEGRDLIGEVTTKKAYAWKGEAKGKLKVVAMDFGVKWNLLRSLSHFGCEIEVVPANMKADEILAMKPDGVFLSNGPGDPAAAPYAADTVKQLVGKVPLFGVCMGHQILALAMGAKTYKLKFGHRGGNQPVLDKETGRVEISSHNHGYAVDGQSIPSGIEVTHMNLNDKTVEGLAVKGKKAFSVQYHPEACPGPHDSVALFERFVKMMG